jgi:PAS domain S-box-containing protein
VTVVPDALFEFRRLADDLPVFVWLQAPDGHVQWANRAWYTYTQLSGVEALTLDGLARVVQPQDLRSALAGWRERGRDPFDAEVRIRPLDGEYRWFLARVVPHEDTQGTGIAWIGTAFDVHDARMRIEERAESFRAIADGMPTMTWTARPDGMLDWTNARWRSYFGEEIERLEAEPPGTLWHPADHNDAIAAWRHSLESGEPFEIVARLRGTDETYRWFLTRATAVREPNGAIRAWYGTNVDIDAEYRANAQLAFFAQLGEELAGTLELDETIDAVTRLVVPAFADGATVALGRTGRPRADARTIAVPLRSGATLRGMLEVRMDRSGRTYGADDVPFFTELARRIVPALENAEAYERERNVAHTFQEAALQPALPDVPGLVFDAIYEAGRAEALIGGDWFDAFRIPDGRIVVSVGDVAGAGLDAAVTMASVRQGIRMVSGVNPDPNVLLDAADRALRASDADRYVTAFVAVIDPVFATLTWASAGHPPPLLRRANGEVVVLHRAEPPLGLRGRLHEPASSLELQRGDLLALYTDGLTEVTRDVLAGEERVREAVARLNDPVDAAETLYHDVLGMRSPSDDVAILTVAFERPLIEAEGARRAWRWTFDARDAETARAVRAAIAERLSLAGADADGRGTAELVFGELIGNVVRYAPGEVDVVLDLSGDAPVLHVVDEGAGFEHNPKLPLDQLSERGRGLFIVAALAEELYVSRRPRGGSHARAVLYAPASMHLAEAARAIKG